MPCVSVPTMAVVGSTLADAAVPALTGAAIGGLGSWATGGNPWQGALLGGLGGGIGGATGLTSGMGSLFGSGADAAATSAAPAAQSALSSGIAAPIWQSSLSTPIADSIANTAASAAPAAEQAANAGLWGNIGKFAPYAALSGGAMLADSMGRPKQVGPLPQQHPSNSGTVSPLSRQMQSVDPNSYYSPSTAVNRSYYSPYSLQPQFMSKGGIVRGFANGGSSSASSSNIPQSRMMVSHPSSYGGKLVNSAISHPAMYPIKGSGRNNLRYYADGGQINGAGDGQSDSIPANLSDGEFVMSAPVVSALGNGSNDAGAKKLQVAQKNILKKHYKGGKPHKAMGLGSYVH